MSPKPKITVHMITYNRAHFITQAIDSVISQTFQDFELLILDDCSTDNTEQILQTYLADPRIRYVKNEKNLGITKNRNKALSLSNGEYITILDSDDYWTDKNKLQQQVNFLNNNPTYTLVGTNMVIIDENNKKIKRISYPSNYFFIKKLLLIKNLFCHSSVMYRKQDIINLRAYDESLPIWEDYDLWLKIGAKYKFANLNIYATAYRKHATQSNTVKLKIGQDTQRLIIEKYKNLYSGYIFAKIINTIRNIKYYD